MLFGLVAWYNAGMCGAELFPVGQGEDGNLRGGAGQRARKSTDPKFRQKCVNCYWRICITIQCFDQGKHYIL